MKPNGVEVEQEADTPDPHEQATIYYKVLEALQEREQGLAAAQRQAQLGSWDWDVVTDRLTWSDELYQVFGLAVGELEPTYEGYLARIHPEDREEQAARVAEALRTHQAYQSLHRILTPSGAVKWVFCLVEVTVHPDGNPTRLNGTAQDVTRLLPAGQLAAPGEAAEAAGLGYLVAGDGADGHRTGNGHIEPDGRAEKIRRALADGQFVLHYQPKVLLANDRISGVEALVRWQQPSGRLVPPDQFIPDAEESGCIVELGAWVIEEACGQAQEWQRRFPDRPPLSMAVNLSARQFGPGLVDTVAGVIARTGIEPWRLCLELTESIIMTDVESAIGILAQLKSLGICVSIDDFGTGYSSLAYLRRFPIDELKIDRSFVNGLGREPEDTAIVAAVVAMAHALDLSVVAEGVESHEQLERLRVLGCEQVQGYYFSRPVPAVDLEELLVGENGRRGGEASTADEEGTGYHGGTVVLADDSPEVLQLAAVSLSAAGFDIHEADNGRTAVELATTLRPSCVVLDVSMPVMGGIEACRALRAHPATEGCTIVMLTSHADAINKVEGFSAGADDYIVKPFAPRDLVGRVRAAIRRRETDPAVTGA